MVLKKVVLIRRLSRWLSLRKQVLILLMNKWFLMKKYKTFSKNKMNAVAAKR